MNIESQNEVATICWFWSRRLILQELVPGQKLRECVSWECVEKLSNGELRLCLPPTTNTVVVSVERYRAIPLISIPRLPSYE